MNASVAPWSLLISRSNLSDARIVTEESSDSNLGPGEASLRIEKFAFTASNITYAAMGEQLYWKFFPAPPGFGKVPVWGYAAVERSNAPALAVGQRLRGYWPLASHTRMQPQLAANNVLDATAHRAQLPAFYNRYALVSDTPSEGEDREVLLLFGTAFLLDDFVMENEGLGARSVVIVGASSKTALATAFLLKQRGVNVIGLTSAKSLAFVQGVGYYDTVLRYDDVAQAAFPDPLFLIDFAGNPAILRAIYARCGDRVVYTAAVGRTHWDASTDLSALSGPEPKLFFAPERVVKRMSDWGPATFGAKYAKGWGEFCNDLPRWLTIRYESGADGALRTYRAMLAGEIAPSIGQMVRLT